jgi:hypothetical protein
MNGFTLGLWIFLTVGLVWLASPTKNYSDSLGATVINYLKAGTKR